MNGSVFPFNVACLVIGVRPLIRHALRRATFPVGEGDLPAGEGYLAGEGDLRRGEKIPPEAVVAASGGRRKEGIGVTCCSGSS